MKVEFIDSEFLGPALFITESEFKRAKSSDKEFESLLHAIEAFSGLFDSKFRFRQNEYDAVLDVLKRNGAVIFTINEDYRIRYTEIIVSNDNQPERVMYADKDGLRLIRHAKVSPKSISKAEERIKKRHKEDLK